MLKWMLLIEQFNLKRGRYSQVVRDYLQVTFSGQKRCVDKLHTCIPGITVPE